MLVLERNPGESLTITTPDDTALIVTVTEIRGRNKASVGIDAPDGATRTVQNESLGQGGKG